jgi:hypothetical protein
VRTDTFRELARGHVGDNVAADGRFVAATLYVQDAALVDAIERGDRREISCGYTCSYDPTPGEYKGEHYDGRQVGITYNHAAIGPRDWGRAGSDVALRMDSNAGISPVWLSAFGAEEGPPMPDEQRKDGEAPPPANEKKHDAGKCDSCGAPTGEDGKYAAPAMDAEKMDSLKGSIAAKDTEIDALRKRLDRGGVVFAGSLLSGASLILLGFSHHWAPAALALLGYGVAWIAAASSLQAAAQFAAPAWVRARAIGIYQVSFFGALAAGSALAGWLGAVLGLPLALGLFGAGAILAGVAVRGFTLEGSAAPAAPAKPVVAPTPKPGSKPAPAVNPEDEKLQKLAERLLGAMADVNEKQRKDAAKQPDKAATKPTVGARPKDKADATQ